MAKLSVYNTIDRSQLGGKFVPLIQSGVSNYKILASDLGKEYHPGDAIEITDTGEINVKFNSNDFELFNSSLSIKTDDARGVFNGGNGIYIKSADNTINVSYGGIKVNTGYGLSAASNGLFVKHANNTIGVSSHGINVYYGSGLTEDSNTGALIVSDTYVRHNFINKLAGQGLYSYIIGYHDSALGVKSADDSIVVSEYGIRVHARAFIGDYLSADYNHNITVDTSSVARAITGSGLVTTNGAIGVNVNTSTGIIVKDNKLYLNAGSGLHTTNNSVRLQIADDTIGVSGSGIRVNYGSGLRRATEDNGQLSVYIGSGLSFDGGAICLRSSDGSIYVGSEDIKVNTGYGLSAGLHGLCVKSADRSIGVSSSGVGVNIAHYNYLYKSSNGLAFDANTLLSYLSSGYGLKRADSSLYVQSADSTISVNPDGLSVYYGSGLRIATEDNGQLSVYLGSGLYFDSLGAICSNTSSVAVGPGITSDGVTLYIQSADSTILAGTNDLKVGTMALAGVGLGHTYSNLYVMSADNSIGVSASGIKVNRADNSIGVNSSGIYVHQPAVASRLASGYGLRVGTGSSLYVQSADDSIGVSENGIKVNTDYNTLKLRDTGLYVDTTYVSGAIAGAGLKAHSNGTLYVRSASGFIESNSYGVGLNMFNLYSHMDLMSSNIEYNGELNAIVAIADGGSKITSLYSGSGISINNTGSVNVDTDNSTIKIGSDGLYVDTSVLPSPPIPEGGDGIAGGGSQSYYLQSSNKTITIGSDSIDVNPSALAGASLYVDSANKTLNVEYGDGLTTGEGALKVRAEDRTISVGSRGIKVHADYLFSSYIDTNTLVYSGNKLSVHLASIAGENIGYDPMSKSLYVSSGGSGGSIVGVDVNAPNGSGAQASGGGVAIGESAHANGGNSVAVGRLSNAHGTQSVAIGYFSSSWSSYKGIAIGDSAVSGGHSSISIGAASRAHYDRSIAVGQEAVVYEEGGISIGGFSGAGSGISIGLSSYTQSGIAVGSEAGAGGSDSIAIGRQAYVDSASMGGIALGALSNSSTDGGVAIGYNAKSSGGIAIGRESSAADGMMALTVYHSSGRRFNYSYGCDGNLYSYNTSGNIYTKSWDNLLTPPDMSTAVTINTDVTYTAEKPLWVYVIAWSNSSSSSACAVRARINGVEVQYCGSNNNAGDSMLFPVKSGDTYILERVGTDTYNPKCYKVYCS